MEALLVIQILALLWLSAVLSGSETGLYGLSRVKLRYRLAREERSAQGLQRLLHPIGPTIITILIGNNLVNQLLTTATERGLQGLGDPWSVLVTILVLTPLVLIFAEFLPKYLFHKNADSWVYQLVDWLTTLRRILALPVRLVQSATWSLERMTGGHKAEVWEPHTSRPNLRTYLNAEAGAHDLSPVQRELVDRVLVMERINLSFDKVSKPIQVVTSLDAAATASAVRNNLEKKVFQRYLVHDHKTAQPMGYITAADLVTADSANTMGALARALPILPETTPMHLALQRMHAEGAEMCLVTDTSGTVTRVAFRGDLVRVLANLDD
ncbi:MAG: CNNM domain-containing protein [Planctomycetota bacterium]|jgi:putative hemolysin|nr:CNNM domain-containing protein [Planctomycetota bacterium]